MRIFFKVSLFLFFLFNFSSLRAQDSTQIGNIVLNITTNVIGVDSFYVAVANDIENAIQVFYKDTLSLPVGQTRLTIFQKNFKDSRLVVSIKPDTILTYNTTAFPLSNPAKLGHLSSYPLYYWQASNIILTDDDTQIFVNGTDLGSRAGMIRSERQKITLTGIAYNGEEFSKSFKTSNKFNVLDFYYRPEKSTLRRASVIPGAAQIYKREYVKAGVFITTVTGLAATSLILNKQYSNEHQKFKELDYAYHHSHAPIQAFELAQKASDQLELAKKKARIRNYFIAGLSAAYLINIIDSFLKPKIGYRSNKVNFNPYVDFDNNSVSLNLKVSGRL